LRIKALSVVPAVLVVAIIGCGGGSSSDGATSTRWRVVIRRRDVDPGRRWREGPEAA